MVTATGVLPLADFYFMLHLVDFYKFMLHLADFYFVVHLVDLSHNHKFSPCQPFNAVVSGHSFSQGLCHE